MANREEPLGGTAEGRETPPYGGPLRLFSLEHHFCRGERITYGMLQALGVERRPGQKPSADENANESALGLEEYLIELHPALSPEEERQLAHMAIRSEKEKKRAEYLNESPDSHVVEEGKIAYFWNYLFI